MTMRTMLTRKRTRTNRIGQADTPTGWPSRHSAWVFVRSRVAFVRLPTALLALYWKHDAR
jgi:hypothetical protein